MTVATEGPGTATDARTLTEMLRRAGRADFEAWERQVRGCGYCARPVRLRGRLVRTHSDGRVETWSTASQPDQVLLVRCGNRRAVVCPSCSYEYAGDMWQLLYAGTVGGRKGVPDTVRAHPAVFLTLTAPGFGPVHTTRTDRGGRCRPRRARTVCPHGRPASCQALHAEDDPALGTPLCPGCYDYEAHAAFNWWAPELWRRFTIQLRRALAARLGVTERGLRSVVVPQYAKVAEFQRRGVVHFHAILRLDGPGDDYPPPGATVPTDVLEDAVRTAASRVRLVVGPLREDEPALALRFGDQTDVTPLRNSAGGPVTPERVAAYIAKYATKSAEDFGLGGGRLHLGALAGLQLSAHIEAVLHACWDLGADPDHEAARRWLHMLGFRGHFSTKSRRFSTTLGRLRAARADYLRANPATGARELGTEADDDTTLVVAAWEFAGIGYRTTGDAALAIASAARARERREIGRIEDAQGRNVRNEGFEERS